MAVTLEELVLAVSANLHDCVRGTASASMDSSNKNKMTDTRRLAAGDNRYLHSQVLFLQPATGLTGINPKTVSSYAAGTGVFTFSDNWNASTGVPIDTPYAIIDIAGEGYPYDDIVAAAKLGLDSLKVKVEVEEAAVAVTVTTGNAAWHTATIPATLGWLSEVHVVRDGTDIGLILPGREGWRIVPGTHRLQLARTLDLLDGDTLTLYGQGPPTFPAALDDEVEVHLEKWVNATIEKLTQDDSERTEQQLAANLYMDRTRTVPQYRRANAYKVG